MDLKITIHNDPRNFFAITLNVKFKLFYKLIDIKGYIEGTDLHTNINIKHD